MKAQERTVDEILAIAEQLPTMPLEQQVETLFWAYARIVYAREDEYYALQKLLERMLDCPQAMEAVVQDALGDWEGGLIYWSPEKLHPYLNEIAQKLRGDTQG